MRDAKTTYENIRMNILNETEKNTFETTFTDKINAKTDCNDKYWVVLAADMEKYKEDLNFQVGGGRRRRNNTKRRRSSSTRRSTLRRSRRSTLRSTQRRRRYRKFVNRR